MATFKLTAPSVFREATTVKAYPASNWPAGTLPSGAPVGSQTASATVTNSIAEFTGLTEGTRYFAAAEVDGAYRYIGFIVPSRPGAELLKVGDLGASGEANKALKADDPAVNNARQASEEVASANPMAVSRNSTLIKVSGTAEIKKITATAAGHVIVLVFLSTAKLVDGENLKLKEAFTATADDTVTLICDGVNWFEIGRSVN